MGIHKRRMAIVLFVLGLAMSMFYALTVSANNFACDVNGDGKCDDDDFAMVAELFGVSDPDPRYDLKCDVNGDGEINIKDLALVAMAMGSGGFFHIPEFWLGTILGLLGCFAAFGVFRFRKSKMP